jgi:hypothetical protein
MKPSLDQRLASFLRGWSHKRIEARIPPGSDFDIGRQTCGVDVALAINDRSIVERSNACCKRIDKLVKVSIR